MISTKPLGDDLWQPHLFDKMCREYRPGMIHRAYRLLGSHETAEDCVQETFERYWRYREKYDPAHSSLRTWLYAILGNVIKDKIGQSYRERSSYSSFEHAASVDEAAVGFEEQVSQQLDAERLWRIVETDVGLKEESRLILILFYKHGKSQEQISQELGINPGTVKSRLFYARKQLKELPDFVEYFGLAPDKKCRNTEKTPAQNVR